MPTGTSPARVSAHAEVADLRRAYARCRRISAEHGKSYHLATRLLPASSRPAVHALYAFARSVDDLVDLPAPGTSPASIAAAVDDIAADVARALGPGPAATSGSIGLIDPDVAAAFVHTARSLRIDPAYFAAFLASMRADIPGTDGHVARYRTMDQLQHYMHGSAAVIGLQMLPILGAGPGAQGPAAALGTAFQLTNFLRDVGEDLDRGRVYLPLDEFAEFGVDEHRLRHARRTGRTDRRTAEALAHFAAVTREHYRAAAPGTDLLPPRPAMCVRAATAVYGGILTAIEDSGYAVFDRRITVPRRRRLAIAARAAAGRQNAIACARRTTSRA